MGLRNRKKKEVFDLLMKVNFCKVHKDFFEHNVKSKSSKGNKLIDATNLVSLIRMTELCIECKWVTLFDSDKL
jgi:hypothetical protein